MSGARSRIIVVDRSIYRDKNTVIPGFHPFPYALNVNHPVIYKFYVMFKDLNGIPPHFPPSDEQRLKFEKRIFDLIKEGRIVVED